MSTKKEVFMIMLLMLIVCFSSCSSDDDDSRGDGITPSPMVTNVLQLVTDKNDTSTVSVSSPRCIKRFSYGDRVSDVVYHVIFSCSFQQSPFFKGLTIAIDGQSDLFNMKVGDTFDRSQFNAKIENANIGLEELLTLTLIRSGRITVIDRSTIDGKATITLKLQDFMFDWVDNSKTDVYTMNGTIVYAVNE